MTDNFTNSLEAQIKDRLETGFKNWNGGYDNWLEWCKTLYEPDAHYNVYGQRLDMAGYQKLMGDFFKNYDIRMGEFHNMIIKDDWCAIRYRTYIWDKKKEQEFEQESFEFVHFKENPAPIGVRVIEGWATSTNPLEA